MIKIIKDSLEKREEIFSVSVEKPDVAEIVSGIIERVKTQGDAALFDFTEKFDKVKLTSLKVSEAEIQEAVQSVEPEFIEILKKAAANIRLFHEQHLYSEVQKGKPYKAHPSTHCVPAARLLRSQRPLVYYYSHRQAQFLQQALFPQSFQWHQSQSLRCGTAHSPLWLSDKEDCL